MCNHRVKSGKNSNENQNKKRAYLEQKNINELKSKPITTSIEDMKRHNWKADQTKVFKKASKEDEEEDELKRKRINFSLKLIPM